MEHVAKNTRKRAGVTQMAHTVQVGGHLGEPSVTTALEALMFPPFVVRVEEVCVAHRQLLSQPATKILLQ